MTQAHWQKLGSPVAVDMEARPSAGRKRTRAKNKGHLSALPVVQRPALLPRIGILIDWCRRVLGGSRATQSIAWLSKPLAWLSRLAYAVLPGNLLWPTLVPARVRATLHVVRDEASGRAVDSWVWVRDGWEVLWQNGAFGKGILSRADPTWAARYRREKEEEEEEERRRRTGGVYLEDITRQRRAARQGTTGAADASDSMRLLDVAAADVGRMEPMQLSPLEALFLSEIGCLEVRGADGDGPPLLHAELFGVLQECHPPGALALRYAAYYYYRARGWVVRSGVKFGSDFLLYRQGGPARAHSQYSVVVRHAEAEGESRLCASWQYAAALSRLCTQARKSLIVCYVSPPPPAAEPDGSSNCAGPPDLRQYEIQEFLVERFNPNDK
ncbi:tRNA splicing endonuclease subunit sen2 [Coemansia javaensis]|uniref:tRNA-intron lyase n=1 Tax=Coemansia javaensis TaxID=2761396 RepID=A0A9W8HG99_9FUNG|nr:tRNA splicing endonuclease subunit sen2 [Coemansia javaensis]